MKLLIVIAALAIGGLVGGIISVAKSRNRWVHRYADMKLPPVDHYRGAGA